ncbi:sensor histidine kinase RegB [Planktotalea sp.]|uniref:sensor histidine kinase RegB n=1 Tax=Planktotalea sp. TaxID=2029877 RepID=UPI0025F87F8B|nr:ActS/PrrB/RegB family redox-sensitive histidine kinase [Planktotalea sp.]
MAYTDPYSPSGTQRHNWIRLRTITMLRWTAILGQLIAIIVAQNMYNLQLELGLCYLVIGASVVGNIVAIFHFPENKRLSETENLLMVVFDLLQLSFLLFLTGGLHNPFSLLILGPVTVSAAVMSLRSTVLLGFLALVIVSLLAQFHLPLRTEQGFILQIPQVFVFGNWVATVIALLFLSAYSWKTANEMHTMAEALQATHLALSREQKLTDIGGVVAAAAHELGTPLATIKLASSELMDELSDKPALAEDAALIHEQADRCREILQSMGRAGKDDLHLRKAPLSAVLEEAAEPHLNRGKDIVFEQNVVTETPQPEILRRPEIIHGLRNLVQNAVDFAHGTVWVETNWTDDHITIRIVDDGTGFPPHLIGRIGDPFMGRRKSEKERKARPEYEGMGLGLFIAKTLLERSGAELRFSNGSSLLVREQKLKRGAIIDVIWPRTKIDAAYSELAQVTGENFRNAEH